MELGVTFEDVSDPKRKSGATYADLEALPENMVGQLIGGELIAFPRPAIRHAKAAGAIYLALGNPFHLGVGGPGGWWFYFEPELHFGEDVLVPDLAGWRRDRHAEPDGPWMTQAPEWICEVLSPSTSKVDRELKPPRYARQGVEHLWMVDPRERSLEVSRRSERGWEQVAKHSGERRVRAEPFDSVELDLALLWSSEPTGDGR